LETFSIENAHLKAVFLNYGAILHQLWVKDKFGVLTNVIQGLKHPEDYLEDQWARGAVVGRFAGRLENPIKIQETSLEIEHEKGVLLHSGSSGWHKKFWTPLSQEKKDSITFEYLCPEGSSGFPGSVHAQVTYCLEASSLCIHYRAIPTKTTHINLTNHAYFNLSPAHSLGNQRLKINADYFLELKENLVPTGVKLPLAHTKFDFRKEKELGSIRLDDYFIINPNSNEIAALYAPDTGIKMKTFTDQPGVVVFTPPHFEALCFETQKFSNTPNIPSFPTTLVQAATEYSHQTRFEFSLV
jgi:aldose 1-epimerase